MVVRSVHLEVRVLNPLTASMGGLCRGAVRLALLLEAAMGRLCFWWHSMQTSDVSQLYLISNTSYRKGEQPAGCGMALFERTLASLQHMPFQQAVFRVEDPLFDGYIGAITHILRHVPNHNQQGA